MHNPVSAQAIIIFAGAADEARVTVEMRTACRALVRHGVRFVDGSEEASYTADPCAPGVATESVILEDPMSPYAMFLEPRWSDKHDYHFMTVLSGSDLEAHEVEIEWKRLTTRLRELVESLRPNMAIAYCQPGRLDRDAVQPNGPCTANSHVTLTPWFYLSQSCLTRDRLLLLTDALGEGLEQMEKGVIGKVVDLPGEPPRAAFAQQLRRDGFLSYLDPLQK